MTYPFIDAAPGEQAVHPAECVPTDWAVVTATGEGSQLLQELNCGSREGIEAHRESGRLAEPPDPWGT